MRKTRRKILALLLGLALCQTAAASLPDTVRIVIVGDVMSHGPQAMAALRPGGDRSNPDDYDYTACFRHVQDRFDAADFLVANLEFPCGVKPYSGFPFFSAPQSLAYEPIMTLSSLPLSRAMMRMNSSGMTRGRKRSSSVVTTIA